MPHLAGTLPEIKERPKVAKRPTIVAPTLPRKKPLVAKKSAVSAERNLAEERVAKWESWIPIAVGIVLGFVAPEIHALASLWSPWGMRLALPFVQLVGLPEIGMSDELTRTLPQLMLYLQFPLEGLLVASNLRRGMRLTAAMSPIPALHFVSGLVLWIVALSSSKPL